mmetsp:Transcript_42697/g.89206  ORF Transcript_42697/g.89206 Transcript_42697/m.89206 type:complete len:125 (+) Transcript_42697:247-621(+)
MSGVSTRLRAACRRYALAQWAAAETLNEPVRRFHPRNQHTTLLHLAAAEGMEQVALVLLERGAKVGALDSCGRTPMECARLRSHHAMATLLFAAQAEAQRRGQDADAVGARRAIVAAARAAFAK